MEKTQQEIRLERIISDHEYSWYKEYSYGTIGNIIHWIYVYCGLHIAEYIQVGEGSVTLYNQPFATFEKNDKLQLPIFYFNSSHPYYRSEFEEEQKIYLESITT